MFEIIFLFITGLYFLILIYLTSGLNNITKKDFSGNPFVSVIIAARNEEKSILNTLNSLARQDYKSFEVIVSDDFSTDNTGQIIDSFNNSHENFRKVIPSQNNYPGKTNALLAAIKEASGEILLFTDADCEVPAGWLRGMTEYYTPDTGMVNGFSITEADGIISGIQSIDLVFLISVAAGIANNGYPASCIGNNMSIRRKVYEETGGYESIQGSITEDYILTDSVRKLNRYSVVFPVDEDILVKTRKEDSLKGLIKQKKRWALGGILSPNISFFLMSAAFITNLMVLISLFLYTQQVLTIIILKISSDLFFLYNIHKKLKITRNLRYFILFEVYYHIYTTILPILILFSKKITWKGREY